MLAALFASVALAGAHAGEPICHGQLAPPTKAEREHAGIENFMRQRAEFGFRSDEAYVRELIQRGVWEYDVGYIPVTPAENRYLRLRDRLELGRAAYRYIARRPGAFGGIVVMDDWPRGPYLRVDVTRDRALHTRRLRELARFPHNLRIRQVAYSMRALKRVQRRVHRDARELKREGFDVETTWIGFANDVKVDLITRRTDAAAVFRQRYGRAVKTRVIATEPTRLECARAWYFGITDGGLELHWGASGSRTPERVEVVEHADRVEVGAVERAPNGFQTDDLVPVSLPVALAAPLGARAVVDAATRLRLRQRGPSPGEPACPVERHSRLDDIIAWRKDFGLPAHRERVRRILRERGYRFTPREQRYIALRRQLERDAQVRAYLRSHRGVDGGVSITDRFPRRPLLVVRVARRRALQEARLRQLARFPGLLRVVPAAATARELRALATRIMRDRRTGFIDGFGDAGFLVTRAEEERGAVVVELATTRADHAAYFRARYGPLARTRVVGDRHECAAFDF